MSDETNYGQYIVRAGGITLIGYILAGASGFLLRVFLARGLTTSEFGLLFAVIAFFSFISVFSKLGLNEAVVRYISKFMAVERPDKVKSSIISSLLPLLGASALITVLVILSSNFLINAYFDTQGVHGKAVNMLIILSIWFFVMLLKSFLNGALKGFKDFFSKTLGEITRDLITLVGVVVLILFFDITLISAAFIYLLGAIIAIALMFVRFKKRHYSKLYGVSGSISKPLIRDMIGFGLPLIFSGVAVSIIGTVDTLMLTGLRPLGDVGLYQVAIVTKTALLYFGSALASPLFPMISELQVKGDKARLKITLNLITKFSFLFIIPAALIFMTFPETIISLLFTSNYLAAANAMRILAASTIFWAVSQSFTSSLSGIGKPKLVLKAMGFAAIFNIFANLLLIPPYGATGAAIATGLSFIIGLFFSFYYSRKEIEFPLPISNLIKTWIGGALTLILLYVLKEFLPLTTWPLLITSLIMGALFYGFWLIKTRIIERSDLEIIKSSTPLPKKITNLLEKLIKN